MPLAAAGDDRDLAGELVTHVITPVVLIARSTGRGTGPPRAARRPRRSPRGRRRRASSPSARDVVVDLGRPCRQPDQRRAHARVSTVAQRSASCGSVRPAPRGHLAAGRRPPRRSRGIALGPKRCSNSGAITPHLSVFDRQSSAGNAVVGARACRSAARRRARRRPTNADAVLRAVRQDLALHPPVEQAVHVLHDVDPPHLHARRRARRR